MIHIYVFYLNCDCYVSDSAQWKGKLFVCFVPTESGKITTKTSKANVKNGTYKWADPIYETTRLLVDSRNKRYDDKFYKLIVGMVSVHALFQLTIT